MKGNLIAAMLGALLTSTYIQAQMPTGPSISDERAYQQEMLGKQHKLNCECTCKEPQR